MAIAFILAAVFLPVAFLGGISGQIFRQFALTIAVSVLISAFSALSLSPALSAMILRPRKTSRGPLGYFFGGFNRAFNWTTGRYLGGVGFLIRRSALALVALAAVYVGAGWLFKSLPGGFLPDEDQGVFFAAMRLPDGASIHRNEQAAAQIEKVIRNTPGVDLITTFGGTDFVTTTNNTNVATIFGTLKPWDERKSPRLSSRRFWAARRWASSGFATRSRLPSDFRQSWVSAHRAGSTSCWKTAPAARSRTFHGRPTSYWRLRRKGPNLAPSLLLSATRFPSTKWPSIPIKLRRLAFR